MGVDRCVCHDVTFASLKILARQIEPRGATPAADPGVVDLTLRELRRMTGCTTGCGTCEPYIRLMLQTGRTRFTVFEGSGSA